MQRINQSPLPDSAARLVGYLHDPADEFITRDPRPCVIVCPGGGYCILASHEAEPIAMQFYTAGYQVFVLYYSVCEEETAPPLGLLPLRELSASVMTIREHSKDWRVVPDQIAVCGFSAGGHLAGSLGVLWDAPMLKAAQDTKGGYNRPNAMILCYPVLLAGEYGHQGSIDNLVGSGQERAQFSLERHVDAGTPPTFLWHTADDDAVPVQNSLLFAGALSQHHIEFESHIFAHGEHGLGLCDNEKKGRSNPHCATWMPLCIEWLNTLFA